MVFGIEYLAGFININLQINRLKSTTLFSQIISGAQKRQKKTRTLGLDAVLIDQKGIWS
jgi:hypothetical protein